MADVSIVPEQDPSLETKSLTEDFLWYVRGKIEGWHVDCAIWTSQHFTPRLGHSIMLLSRDFRKGLVKVDALRLYPFNSKDYEMLFAIFARGLNDPNLDVAITLCYLLGFSAQVSLILSNGKRCAEIDDFIVATLCKYVNESLMQRLVQDGGYTAFVRFVLEEGLRLYGAMTDAVVLRAGLEVDRKKTGNIPDYPGLFDLEDVGKDEWEQTKLICAFFWRRSWNEEEQEKKAMEYAKVVQAMMDEHQDRLWVEAHPLQKRLSKKRLLEAPSESPSKAPKNI